MDFQEVLRDVEGFFVRGGFRRAIVGALALHTYGFQRATADLDFVIDGAARDSLVPFLEARGYETLHASAGYSNHVHADPAKGRVDAIYVDQETADRLFAGCRAARIGSIDVLVPRPEHLAAMKVHAMKNDPSRTFLELADIQFLLGLPDVDRDEIRGYFERAGLEERFHELESRS